MIKSVIKGYGYYVPENVVTNDDLSKLMTTNDEWITERTGIKERRHRKNRNHSEQTTAFLAKKAAENRFLEPIQGPHAENTFFERAQNELAGLSFRSKRHLYPGGCR